MSKTLNLVDRLVTLARTRLRRGQTDSALRVLRNLSAFPDLPAHAEPATLVRFAAVLLRLRHFRKARRHLLAALVRRPADARAHALLARALAHIPTVEPARALRHYRRALRMEPARPRWRAAYGRLLVKAGRTDDGLAQLRQAAADAPDDFRLLGGLVAALGHAGQGDEAERVLQAAGFRHGRNLRFQALRDRLRFRELRRRQTAERKLAPATSAPAVILPFLRLTPATARPRVRRGGRILRCDQAARPAAPHFPRVGRRNDPKHAP
jgi:tetratricopeptide (TPR) repeat protein